MGALVTMVFKLLTITCHPAALLLTSTSRLSVCGATGVTAAAPPEQVRIATAVEAETSPSPAVPGMQPSSRLRPVSTWLLSATRPSAALQDTTG